MIHHTPDESTTGGGVEVVGLRGRVVGRGRHESSHFGFPGGEGVDVRQVQHVGQHHVLQTHLWGERKKEKTDGTKVVSMIV